MTRFLVLFLFLIWMAWRPAPGQRAPHPPGSQLALFLGFYVFLVGILGLWARLLARRVRGTSLHRQVRYFDNVILGARLGILAWFAIGVFFLGWGDLVTRVTGPFNRLPVQLPQTIAGTLPCILAWMALWWSQYPAERALREQNMMVQFDQELPLRSPPSFASFFLLNLRLQILFTAVPLLLILLIHDVIMVVLWRAGMRPTESLEGAVTLSSALVVFLFAPVIIRRVLHTQPLPDGPLRRTLEAFCREHKLRYRDILIWQTNHNLGNAAVMGIIPQVRYILMSDLLLETMTPEQIEAVFAHEVGHIVHRHMIWYLVFFKGLMLALMAAALLVESYLRFVHLPGWLPMDLVMTLAGAGGFLIAFGFVSRRFERQADVFAARQMERRAATQLELTPAPALVPCHVGPYGARIFSSALHKVAIINGMPITGKLWRNWCHGSIDTRMRYLLKISEDPAKTRKFDRFMTNLYAALLVALVVTGGLWIIVERSGILKP